MKTIILNQNIDAIMKIIVIVKDLRRGYLLWLTEMPCMSDADNPFGGKGGISISERNYLREPKKAS